jgi:hypothetical protein
MSWKNSFRKHVTKASVTYLSEYSALYVEWLSAGTMIALHRALIRSVMTERLGVCGSPPLEIAASAERTLTVGGFCRRDLRETFKIRCVYDNITKLCREQAEAIQNYKTHVCLNLDKDMPLMGNTELSKRHVTHITVPMEGLNSTQFDWNNKHTISPSRSRHVVTRSRQSVSCLQSKCKDIFFTSAMSVHCRTQPGVSFLLNLPQWV